MIVCELYTQNYVWLNTLSPQSAPSFPNSTLLLNSPGDKNDVFDRCLNKKCWFCHKIMWCPLFFSFSFPIQGGSSMPNPILMQQLQVCWFAHRWSHKCQVHCWMLHCAVGLLSFQMPHLAPIGSWGSQYVVAKLLCPKYFGVYLRNSAISLFFSMCPR